MLNSAPDRAQRRECSGAAGGSSTSPLEFSAPRALFPDKFLRTQGDTHTHFDVGGDGRFLLIESLRAGQPQSRLLIHVALNWAETVKRLAPTGR